MRYKTAAILSIMLIGGTFGLPDAIKFLFLPSLEQGVPTSVPAYERVLLDVAFICFRFRWLLALPIAAIVVALFSVAGFTSVIQARKLNHSSPR